MKYLEGYMERHTEGEETDLHFLMIDLDDFKQINDTYGHVEGDRALIRIAGVLKKNTGRTCRHSCKIWRR